MTDASEWNAARIGLVLTGLVLAAVVVPYLQLPFAGEQGMFAFYGWRLAQGEVPYRDFWDLNFPGVFAMHAIADALFGHNMRAIRLFDVLWMLATGLFLFRVARRAFGPLAASATVLLAAATYFTLGHQPTAQRDGWCLLPLLVMIDVIESAASSSRRIGLVIGLATWFLLWVKPPFLLVSAVCAAALLMRRRAAAIPALGIAAGVFGAASALVLLFFWKSDALGDLYEQVVLFNAEYSRNRYALPELLVTFASLAIRDPMWVVGIVGMVAALRHASARLLIAAAAACLAVVVVQGKLFGYHLVPLRILLCAGAASLAVEVWRARRWTLPARAAAAGIAGLAIWMAVGAFRAQEYPSVWQSLARGGGVGAREEIALANFLASHTRPNDTVLVWGVGTPGTVHYLAKRRSPTRFVVNYPFSTSRADSPLMARWRREFIDTLRKDPPRAVVVVGGDAWEAIKNVDSKVSFERFTELREFVAQHYGRIGGMQGRSDLRYEIFARGHAEGADGPPTAP